MPIPRQSSRTTKRQSPLDTKFKVKKTVRQSVRKKTDSVNPVVATPKARTVRSVRKAATPTRRKKTQTILEKPKTADLTKEVIKIPSRVPLRLIERKILFERMLAAEGIIPARRIAIVGGLCFVLTGAALFWSSSSLYSTVYDSGQPALLTCVDDENCSITEQPPATAVETNPVISFVQALPDTIDSDTPVSLVAEGALHVVFVISSYETGRKVEVQLEPFANTWRGVIPFMQLAPGKHMLFARVDFPNKVVQSEKRYFYVRPLDSSIDTTSDVPSAQPIASNLPETISSTTDADTENDSETNDSPTSLDDDIELPVSNGDPTAMNTNEPLTTIGTTKAPPEPAQVETENLDEIEVIVTEDEKTTEIQQPENTTIIPVTERLADQTITPLSMRATQLPDAAWRFAILYPKNLRFVEVYVRNTRSTTVQFAGLAKQFTVTEWRFFLSDTDYPPGTYEVIARSRAEDGQKLESAPALVSITSPVQAENHVSAASQADVPAPLNAPIEREYIKVTSVTPDTAANEQISSPGQPIPATDALRDRTESVNEALRSLAAAKQTNDPMVIESAQRQLLQIEADATTELVAKGGGISEAEALREQFRVLQQRVEQFERLRSERDADAISRDTDGDGISDYDEQNLFGTNPSNPDTDEDGVWDGVEISRGFNPLDVDEDALIVYESPREVIALVVPEVLSVSAVKPVLSSAPVSDERVPEPVLAQISGTALPNSFVTLYIFSTPTIVTVKTDADGSFVYTFEKELQDGSHDVYVAITDNAGSIVARSNPFQFFKEAQAFTPVDAAADVAITSTPLPEIQAQNAYSMVAGIGVLALGVILLMLGLGLRTHEDDPSAVTHKPA